MTRGLYMVDRSMLKHRIVGIQNHARYCMWSWMLAAAGWEDRTIFVNGVDLPLKRGQLFVSIRTFAEENHVSKGVAERFLRDLKTGSMIETESKTGGTIITICNYDRYQNFGEYAETRSGTQDETATGQQQDADETAAGHKRTPLTPLTTSSSSLGDSDMEEVRSRLLMAAEGVVDPQSFEIKDITVPLVWLEQGIGLDLICGAVERRCKAMLAKGPDPKPIRHWKYFQGCVEDAVREAAECRIDLSAPPPEDKAKPKKSKRTRLPDDWTLPDDAEDPRGWHATAIKNGVPPDLIAVEEAKFRDHHHAHGKLMADWKAAWRTWTRNAKDFNYGPRNHQNPKPDPSAPISARDRLRAAIDQAGRQDDVLDLVAEETDQWP